MIATDSRSQSKIRKAWDAYISANKELTDTRGKVIDAIDEKRSASIVEIKEIIRPFLSGASDIYTFKSILDGYNKRNNWWGFSAIKGQMFFNLLTKVDDDEIEKLTALIKSVIQEPKHLEAALEKIRVLEEYTRVKYDTATDKRKIANPSSVAYFLTYFWQIYNPGKWQIYYTSLIDAYEEIGVFQKTQDQVENYRNFYQVNEEIKDFLAQYTGLDIQNWDVEHAFWHVKQEAKAKDVKPEKKKDIEIVDSTVEIVYTPNFNVRDYLIPRVANLLEIGADTSKSGARKGSEFEKKVAEVFKLLDFEVEELGQGTGRNPDAILKFRSENIAFIVDAKAYSNGYSLGLDDRAIREYINYHCPELDKQGYKKIGFIIVCNSFKSDFSNLINDLTWNTPIKRFILLTTDALLHLLAYKIKDGLDLTKIVDCLIKVGTIVEASHVVQEFDDV